MNVFPEERGLPEGRHHQLKEFVMTEIKTAPKPRRRFLRPMFLAPAAGIAAAAVVAPLLWGGGQAAFAVTRTDDGLVGITFKEAHDPEPLEEKLRSMGINVVVDYIPAGKNCEERPRSTNWVPKEEAPLSHLSPEKTEAAKEPTFFIDPSAIKEGQTGVLAFSVDYKHPAGVVGGIWARVSAGPVKPCTLVDSDRAPLDLE
jgi:hypothetical protein